MQDGRLTIVIPVHNEAENAEAVIAEAASVFSGAFTDFEIIAVDDGSTDGSWAVLEAAAGRMDRMRAFRHPRRSGKSAALRTGMLAARTLWVATMDGDGQDDPRSVVDMAAQIDLGAVGDAGLVCGCRTNRTDGANRKLASRIGNGIRRTLLRDDCPDTACGLKIIPRGLFLALPFFDALHRYLPPLTRHVGFESLYVPVINRPRLSGGSKYTNLGRAAAGLFDLTGVIWLMRRTTIPSREMVIGREDRG